MTPPTENDLTGPLMVATDFSPGSRIAMRRAARLAKARERELLLVHVWDERLWDSLKRLFIGADGEQPSPLMVARRRLEEDAALLAREAGIPEVRCEIHAGSAPEGLAAIAEREGACLLVLGRHGESWSGDELLGSTALKAAQQTRVPILVAQLDIDRDYDCLLLASDFSKRSQRACRLVRHLFPHTRQILMHAYHVPFEGRMRMGGASEADITRYREEERVRAQRRLQAFVGTLTEDGWQGSAQLTHGFPTALILDHSRRHRTELVVLGRHANAATEFLLGSVTQNVLHKTEGDLLVVP